MPAIPIIAAGIAAGGSVAAAKMQSNAAKRATAAAQAAQKGAMEPASRLVKMQEQIYGAARPGYTQALNYYSTLLGAGGRPAIQAAVAPAAENIAAGYSGTERAIRGSMRGGVRDLALAEAARGRAGDIGRLTAGVQPEAASRLLAAGQGAAGTAVGAGSAAGNIYSSLLPALLARQGAAESGQATAWGNLGSILVQLLRTWGGGGGGAGYQGLPVGYGSSLLPMSSPYGNLNVTPGTAG